jgi:hypothetical protein
MGTSKEFQRNMAGYIASLRRYYFDLKKTAGAVDLVRETLVKPITPARIPIITYFNTKHLGQAVPHWGR